LEFIFIILRDYAPAPAPAPAAPLRSSLHNKRGLPPPPIPLPTLGNPTVVRINTANISTFNAAVNPVAPAPLVTPPAPVGGNSDIEEGEEEGQRAVGQKEKRVTKKFTLWNFVDRIDGSYAYCKCGCLENDGSSRKKYYVNNSGNITPHLEKYHPNIYSLYSNCLNNVGNYNELIDSINALDFEAQRKTKKRKKDIDLFFEKAGKMDKAITNELRLMLWAITNGISRNALNDPLFDSYLLGVGSSIAPNRHTMHDRHLPILDNLITDDMIEQLKNVQSVSLSSDGWRDRARRDWINVVVTWCDASLENSKRWSIFNVEPDLIFLPTSATSESIAYLINSALDNVVLSLSICLFSNDCPNVIV
jgi:hypothetical protein